MTVARPATPEGISTMPDGAAPAPPLLAEAWLRAWEAVNGGVTISIERKIYPWRMPQLDAQNAQAERLIAQLIDTPGLPQGVRIVLVARQRAARKERL